MKKLAQERVSGRFKNDTEGFIKSLQELSKTMSPLRDPKNTSIKGGKSIHDISGLLEDIFDDRERFQ